MKKYLSLSYKGNRNYLHGSDFFNALTLIRSESSVQDIIFLERLTFRKFIRNNCYVTTEFPGKHSCIAGELSFRLSDGSTLDGWLVEGEEAVTGRSDFDEDGVLIGAMLETLPKRIFTSKTTKYTVIEIVIALTKKLNYAICPTVNGKWVFGQLNLFEPLPAVCKTIEIRMKNLIAKRFSINEIHVDGRIVGTIKFIVGEPS